MDNKESLLKEQQSLKEKIETMISSESSLSKDWLKSEEDQAWAHL